jgi:hypothetical protein
MSKILASGLRGGGGVVPPAPVDTRPIELSFNGAFFTIPTSGKKNGESCDYNWHVVTDEGEEEYDVQGVTNDTGFSVQGLPFVGVHYVVIYPRDGKYTVGWGAAFGFGTGTTGANSDTNKSKLCAVVVDPDWAHMYTETDTGDYFRANEFYNSGISAVVSESLPSSVTRIGNNFRRYQYNGCTGLSQAAAEVVPDSVTSIGTYFRYGQYQKCTNLTKAAAEVVPVRPGNGIRYSQYEGCIKLRVGTYIHDTRFAETLNRNLSDYGRMFCVSDSVTTSDTMPKYYLEDGVTTAPVTNLTPTSDKSYVTNRTGISGYASLDENWK